MRWDKLSMKEKGELMKLYMSGGVLSISEMKKHYNSYADGGDAYITKKAEEARLAALERSRTMTKPIVPMVPNPLSQEDFEKNQDDIQKFVKKKLQSLEDEGKIRTIPSLSSQLKDKTYYANKGVENYVREVNNPNGIYAVGKYQSLVPGQSCMSTASGTYCKSITGNQSFAADPAKYGFKRVPNSEVLPGDLVQALTPENNIPNHAMIYDSMGEDNKPRYNYSSGGKDEASIVKRGKYPASNDKLYTYRFVGDHADSVKWRKEYNKKAFGGPLRDGYDNPEQYYDYNTAEEAGDMYDEKSKHWASRDPRTGMILKNPKHPTFNLAINEDEAEGYRHFYDPQIDRHYTLNSEEYAIAPNKATLQRVDTDFGGIKTTKSRPYNPKLISKINRKLEDFGEKQRASLLGDIIEESGGNPFAMSKDSTYQGLLQWESSRYKVPDYGPVPTKQDTITELNNQLNYLRETLKNTEDKKSWTHGGKGSHFKSGKQANDTFWNEEIPIDSIHRALSFGYIRPAGKEDSYRNRQKVVNQVFKRINKK